MPPATTFASLPDDLIAAVLGQLEAVERFTTAALVCRRWHQLLVSWPELHPSSLCLRTADVARFHSLRAWLLRHSAGGSLKRLNIDLRIYFSKDYTFTKLVTDGLRTAITDLMPACAAGLTELVLETDSLWLVIGAWVEGMRQLTRLHVSDSVLALAADMRGLTALVDLSLDAEAQKIKRPHALPPSLTRLELVANCDSLKKFPQQVSSLTRLHTLRLNIACEDRSSFSVLTALSSLRQLALHSDCEVPPCLSQLTGLTRLDVSHFGDMLEHYNAPGWSHGDVEAVLAALPQLSRLQHVVLLFEYVEGVLPAGAWLGRLRGLVTRETVLSASIPALAAATQLTYLGVASAPGEYGLQLSDLEPLLQLPSLRHVAVAGFGPAALQAFSAATNPALRVDEVWESDL